MASPDPLIRMRGITKRFGQNEVLRDVTLEVFPGEAHILAGENGAGKSTLVKILAGVYQDWGGTIEYFGQPTRPSSPTEAMRLGVSVIYQELSLVPAMTVADNIFLGAQSEIGSTSFVRRGRQRAAAGELLQRMGFRIDPGTPVEELPIAEQQLVEIAKALSREARVLVMDEPTSALTAVEVYALFELIGRLKREGRGIVYITHKMEEIERIADRITVLRDGQRVASRPAPDLPPAELVRLIASPRSQVPVPKSAGSPPGTRDLGLGTSPERLRVEGFSITTRHSAVAGVDLEVHAGEVVGLAGLQGSGISQLLLGLFGAYGAAPQGAICRNGKRVCIASPRDAIRHGLALLTADRKATGLVLCRSIRENLVLADLRRLAPRGWRSFQRERRAAGRLATTLQLKAASLEMETGELSGGNQQKVALAKWIQTDPQVLLLDEPTRGIDVGARQEIYQLIDQWKASGMAILLSSTEVPELLALCDRIIVMHRGRVSARFERAEATPEKVLEAAMGS